MALVDSIRDRPLAACIAASTAAASAVAAVVVARARYSAPEQHSKLYAYFTFGPIAAYAAERRVQQRLYRRLMQAFSRNPAEKLASYKHQPSDVVVAVPAKSGTTWLMQIAHELRMRGSEYDFEDQMDIMPWLEGGAASVLHQDINMSQPGEPRVFKSHMPWQKFTESPLPPDLKLIYCFRDLQDQAYSGWRFLLPFFELTQDDVSFSDFCIHTCVSGHIDRSLNNLCDFWEHRHDDRVCFFFFDDLKERHQQSVQRVQKFMGLGNDDALTLKVIEKSTHAFMSRPDQVHKFDDHKIIHAIDKLSNRIRTMPLTGKVRKDGGKSGDGDKMAPAVKAWLTWRWRCIVQARTGFSDLASMRAQWDKELENHGFLGQATEQ